MPTDETGHRPAPVEPTIRDIEAGDLDAVLGLNEAAVPAVNSLSPDEMRWFIENAPYFRVIDTGKRIGSFLVGLRPGLDYASPNYRWFAERYADFGYVDRVAVADHARRSGHASRLYADFAASLPDSVTVMTCEVNIRPRNDGSLRFHERQGFERVGTQQTEGGRKEVALLAKTLQEATIHE